MLAGLLVVAAACGGGDVPAVEGDGAASHASEPEAANLPADAQPTGVTGAPELVAPGFRAIPGEALASREHQRYQQLRVETLRLMIEAARRALPIGPFQQRMDAASRTALQDVSEAADRMEEIVAELQQAITDDG